MVDYGYDDSSSNDDSREAAETSAVTTTTSDTTAVTTTTSAVCAKEHVKTCKQENGLCIKNDWCEMKYRHDGACIEVNLDRTCVLFHDKFTAIEISKHAETRKPEDGLCVREDWCGGKYRHQGICTDIKKCGDSCELFTENQLFRHVKRGFPSRVKKKKKVTPAASTTAVTTTPSTSTTTAVTTTSSKTVRTSDGCPDDCLHKRSTHRGDCVTTLGCPTCFAGTEGDPLAVDSYWMHVTKCSEGRMDFVSGKCKEKWCNKLAMHGGKCYYPTEQCEECNVWFEEEKFEEHYKHCGAAVDDDRHLASTTTSTRVKKEVKYAEDDVHDLTQEGDDDSRRHRVKTASPLSISPAPEAAAVKQKKKKRSSSVGYASECQYCYQRFYDGEEHVCDGLDEKSALVSEELDEKDLSSSSDPAIDLCEVCVEDEEDGGGEQVTKTKQHVSDKEFGNASKVKRHVESCLFPGTKCTRAEGCMRLHHSGRCKLAVQHVCEHCDKEFGFPSDLKRHSTNKACQKKRGIYYGGATESTVKKAATYVCEHCEMEFSSAFTLNRHSRNKMCQTKRGGDDDGATQNIGSKAEEKPGSIEVCEKTAECDAEEGHSGSCFVHVCEHCSKNYGSKRGLEGHVESKICQIAPGTKCNRMEGCVKDYGHYSQCTFFKPRTCERGCNKFFPRRVDFERHMEMKGDCTAEKFVPKGCPRGCDKILQIESAFKAHLALKGDCTAEKFVPKGCPRGCDKIFQIESVFKAHMALKGNCTAEKFVPKGCPRGCDKIFQIESAFKAHMVLKGNCTAEKFVPKKCSSCNNLFRQRVKFERHVGKVRGCNDEWVSDDGFSDSSDNESFNSSKSTTKKKRKEPVSSASSPRVKKKASSTISDDNSSSSDQEDAPRAPPYDADQSTDDVAAGELEFLAATARFYGGDYEDVKENLKVQVNGNSKRARDFIYLRNGERIRSRSALYHLLDLSMPESGSRSSHPRKSPSTPSSSKRKRGRPPKGSVRSPIRTPSAPPPPLPTEPLRTTNVCSYGVLAALFTPATILIVPKSHNLIPPTSDAPDSVHRSHVRKLALKPTNTLFFSCGLIHSGNGRQFSDEYTDYQSPVSGPCVCCSVQVDVTAPPTPPSTAEPATPPEPVCTACAKNLPVRAHFYLESTKRAAQTLSVAQKDFRFDPSDVSKKRPAKAGYREEGKRGDLRLKLCDPNECKVCPKNYMPEILNVIDKGPPESSIDGAPYLITGTMAEDGYEVWSPGKFEYPIKASDVLCKQLNLKGSSEWEVIFNKEHDDTIQEAAPPPLMLNLTEGGKELTGHRNQLKLNSLKAPRGYPRNTMLGLTTAFSPLLDSFQIKHDIVKHKLVYNAPVLLYCEPGTPDQTLHRDWPRHVCNPEVVAGGGERGAAEKKQRRFKGAKMETGGAGGELGQGG